MNCIYYIQISIVIYLTQSRYNGSSLLFIHYPIFGIFFFFLFLGGWRDACYITNIFCCFSELLKSIQVDKIYCTSQGRMLNLLYINFCYLQYAKMKALLYLFPLLQFTHISNFTFYTLYRQNDQVCLEKWNRGIRLVNNI